MNEKQAREAGYLFAGHYSHYKEEVKEEAKKIRQQGNKAIVVNVPPSNYSRSHHGMGYSVYWIESEENKTIRLAKEKERKISSLKCDKERLMEEIQELDKKLEELING